jgi:hypothetical protein
MQRSYHDAGGFVRAANGGDATIQREVLARLRANRSLQRRHFGL